MALNSGMQTSQISRNDDDVCILSLSSILLAVLIEIFVFCEQQYVVPSCQKLGITLKSVLKIKNVNKKVLAPKLILENEKNQKYLHSFYTSTFSQLSTMSIFYLQYLSLSMLIL